MNDVDRRLERTLAKEKARRLENVRAAWSTVHREQERFDQASQSLKMAERHYEEVTGSLRALTGCDCLALEIDCSGHGNVSRLIEPK